MPVKGCQKKSFPLHFFIFLRHTCVFKAHGNLKTRVGAAMDPGEAKFPLFSRAQDISTLFSLHVACQASDREQNWLYETLSPHRLWQLWEKNTKPKQCWLEMHEIFYYSVFFNVIRFFGQMTYYCKLHYIHRTASSCLRKTERENAEVMFSSLSFCYKKN